MSTHARRFALNLGAAAALALVLGIAAAWATRAQDRREAEQSRAECAAVASAFTRAAASWIDVGSRHQLERVTELLLLGTAVYVEIRDSYGPVIASRDDAWSERELPARRAEGPGAQILGTGAGLVGDAVVEGDGMSVRIGFALHDVAAEAGARRWMAASCAAGVWVVGSGAWVVLTRRRRRPQAQMVEDAMPVARSAHSSRLDLAIDDAAKVARLGDACVPLPPKPYQLLAILVNEGRVVSDTELLTRLWSDNRFANSSDVRQCVYLLRQKMEQVAPGAGRAVVNVKGFGYRYDAERLPGPSAAAAATLEERSPAA